MIPLAEPIPAARFFSLGNHVKNVTALNVDDAAKDESRIFYTPAIATTDSEYECFIEEGPFLDWNRLPLQETVENASPPRPNASHVSVTAPDPIANGSRNQSLFKIGKRMAEVNLSETAICAALLAENERLCDVPLPAAEVKTIAANVIKYPLHLDNSVEDNAQPVPLPENKVRTPELNENLLPEAWQPWLVDISDRLQCPLDYATVAALVSAASLIGNPVAGLNHST